VYRNLEEMLPHNVWDESMLMLMKESQCALTDGVAPTMSYFCGDVTTYRLNGLRKENERLSTLFNSYYVYMCFY